MPAPIAPEERLSKVRSARFNRTEDALLQRFAEALDLTITEFLREAALAKIAAARANTAPTH